MNYSINMFKYRMKGRKRWRRDRMREEGEEGRREIRRK